MLLSHLPSRDSLRRSQRAKAVCISLNSQCTKLIPDRIIRMIFIIPVFAVCALLSVAFLKSSIYIQPIDTLYESFALSAFFLYLLCCIQEDDDERQSFFESSGQMAGYRVSTPSPILCKTNIIQKTALMVFQFPVVLLLIFILTEITEATGTYCASATKLYFASIWVSVITAVSTGAAVMSVLKFYKSMKAKVGERKPLTKLIGFKAIVGVTWLQNVRFTPHSLISSCLTPNR
jgi:hypothetical protein